MAKTASRTAQMSESAEEGVIIDARTGSERADNPLIPMDDIDTESSWDDWIEGLKGTESTGTVRVYKLPLDAQGNPTMTRGAKQIQLMSCAHQQYSFDDLIVLVKERFMIPGELATIRISGTRSGHRGVMFNRVITVQREAGINATSSEPTQLAGVLSVIQSAQQRQAELMERILRPDTGIVPQSSKPVTETMKEWAAILGPVLAPIVGAIAARMVAPAPKSDIGEMIGAVMKLKGLADDIGGGSKDDDSSMASIIKAVAPDGLRLLTTLAANQPARVPPTRRIPPTATPVVPTQAPATTVNREPSHIVSDPTQNSVPKTTSENEAVLAQIKPQLEMLADLAAGGADPKETAKLVMDTLPDNDQVDDQVYGLISNKESFDRLHILSPKIKAQADWFERLRLALLDEFGETESSPKV